MFLIIIKYELTLNMKTLYITILACFSLLISTTKAQQRTENLIVITTDGLRWQEVFGGMDTSIANNRRFNQGDSLAIYRRFWSENTEARRSKLLPFLWSTIWQNGQIYGNRNLGSKVNTSNSYWFSYPGYSEIFCGFFDPKINSNDYRDNPNVNVLEYINKQPKYKGKVYVFAAWEALNRILNENRSGVPVVAAFDHCGGKSPDQNEVLINSMLNDSFKPFGESECLDVFTHYAAINTLKKRKPKVLYISYGETDEWAHHGYYKSYLEAAQQFDKWVKEIWDYVQSDKAYRNKTTLLITVDHGRGNSDLWTDHGSNIPGASGIWFAAMGPDTPHRGEVKTESQFYQNQFAQTIASFLQLDFKADHPVGKMIEEVKK